MSTLRRRTDMAVAIVQAEIGRARRILVPKLRGLADFRSGAPERLLIAPQDIRTADPTIAEDIYAGHLVLAGAFVDAHGASPFDVPTPNQAWAEALHGFGWLRHLRAANTALSRANARALVEDWIAQSERTRVEAAWVPSVVARRLLSWAAQSPMVLVPPDATFYRRLMRSIGRQTAYLQRVLAGGLAGEARLRVAVALAAIGLCAEGLPTARRKGSRALADELGRQILPDGGHLSRDPGVLVDLLLDLLPLRQSYAARSVPVPPALLNAIDRIIPMIRMFRHGDGTLAFFNGMGVTEPDVLATVLTYDDVRARPLGNAPHSGYQRIEAGSTLLICDMGAPPRGEYSNRAHAGTLSFELSSGQHRLVVNCGRPAAGKRAMVEAARSTAAHSTLVMADASSSRFATPGLHRWLGEQIVAGPQTVECARTEDGAAIAVEASHDGYVERFGLVHRRRLVLDRSGDRLAGKDDLIAGPRPTPATPRPFCIRFHLHPAARPEPLRGGRAVLITLPDDQRWLFEGENNLVAVEESILFAAARGMCPTRQIVMSGTFPDVAMVHWSFTRLGPTDRHDA